MAEVKTIYCPCCGHRVTKYDGKQSTNPSGKCKKCGKLVVYHVDTGETVLKDVPKRTQGSGMRFY